MVAARVHAPIPSSEIQYLMQSDWRAHFEFCQEFNLITKGVHTHASININQIMESLVCRAICTFQTSSHIELLLYLLEI